MVHTFLKKDKTYAVGLWVHSPHGYGQFQTLFEVKEIVDALHAVNILNGGAGIIQTFPAVTETVTADRDPDN